MNIFLLRHAEAVDMAATDFGRSLTQKGEQQCCRIANFCKKNEIEPDLILSSPYIRSRQTAEIVARELSASEPVLEEILGCGMRPEQAMGLIKLYAPKAESIMLIGHEPDLGTLGAWFIGARCNTAMHVRKASLAGFYFDDLEQGRGSLEFFIPVKYT